MCSDPEGGQDEKESADCSSIDEQRGATTIPLHPSLSGGVQVEIVSGRDGLIAIL